MSPYPQRGTPALGLEDPESPSLGVDSGRQSLYRHRRADTEAIKYGGSNGAWSESLDRVRKRIEASFSTLVRSLTLQAAQVKTFLSLTRRVRLWTRVNLKIAAFNLIYSGVLFRWQTT